MSPLKTLWDLACPRMTLALLLLLAASAAGEASAAPLQAGEPQPSSSEEQEKDEQEARTYSDVITGEAETDEGLFDVHWVDETLYFEIPDSMLGRDMLLVSRISKVPTGFPGFSPAGVKTGEQLLRWERRGDRILLRTISYSDVADDTLAVSTSVQSNNFSPIIESFEIEAESDTPSLTGLSRGLRSQYGVSGLDADRSFINYARSFPLNVDVRHTMTYQASDPPAQARTGTISMEMHQSMILLPAEPLRPRYEDPRVGWFSISRTNFGLDELKAADEALIQRWRLEPSDPEAYARGDLVDPVKPIVYYLDPGTPEQWRPYVRMGVEDWQAAFETAGFSNAIVALDAPSPEDDPTWNGRTSVTPSCVGPPAWFGTHRGRACRIRGPERSSRATSSGITTTCAPTETGS